MQIGLIGSGNMARALARGWGRAGCCAPTRWPSARGRSPRRPGARRSPRTPRWRSAPSCVVLCHKPAQLRDVAGEVGAARARGRLDPRGDPARGAARPPTRSGRSTASSRRCPSRCAGAPSCRPPIASRSPRSTRPCESCSRELGTLVTLDDAARGRRDGPDVLRARLRGAGRRGADRRGGAPRHPGGAGRRAGRADARRHRRAAAPPRARHARGAPRGHLAGGSHRARAATRWSEAGCGRVLRCAAAAVAGSASK